MIQIEHKNFKCEDCGNDKFTLYDDFDGKGEINLHCSSKECATYVFSYGIKQSSSFHPPKKCSCGKGTVSSMQRYCSMCGKKVKRSY